jgi:hypothetical protein
MLRTVDAPHDTNNIGIFRLQGKVRRPTEIVVEQWKPGCVVTKGRPDIRDSLEVLGHPFGKAVLEM